jgi:simple sugar transport system ATP-binding protein
MNTRHVTDTGLPSGAGTGGSTSLPNPVGLAVDGLSKTYGHVEALKPVTFAASGGEALALLGDNGAGKSTLVKILAGMVRPDSGSIALDGVEVEVRDPLEARRLGIETVHQHLALVDTLSVTENLFLNREELRTDWLLRRIRWLDDRRMDREARRMLAEMHIVVPDLRMRVDQLSGGQRQAIAVARAAGWGQRIVLLDEPAAALGVEQTRVVLDLVRRLRESGILVVLITHNMEHVLEVCTRAIVLRQGRIVADVATSEVTASDLVHYITGAQA